MPKFYTVKQVAQALNFSTNTVYKYLDEGKIQSTRLGKEGRFRIPEKEVVRLLNLKGDEAQLAPSLENTPVSVIQSPSGEISVTTEQSINYSEEDRSKHSLSILRKVSNPDLFDWFLSLVAIFVGIAYFLFPLSFKYLQIEQNHQLLFLFKMITIISGIALVAVDVFVPTKRIYHVIARIPLILSFAGLAYLLYTAAEYVSFSYFLILSIFAALPLVWRKYVLVKFLAFILINTLASGILFSLNPYPFFFLDLRDFIALNLVVFQTILISVCILVFILLIYTSKQNKGLFVVLCLFLSAIFFGLSIDFLLSQAWNRALINLLISVFLIIIPFNQKFDSLSDFTRQQILFSFCWLVVVLVIGVALIKYTQDNFKSYILKESKGRLTVAARIVRDEILESREIIESIAKDENLILSLSQDLTTNKIINPSSTISLDKTNKNLYVSTPNFKRVLIYDSNGVLVSFYPPNNNGYVEKDISGKNFFQQARGHKATISDLSFDAQNNPSILLNAAILDSQSQFRGVISGELDLNRLTSKIADIINDKGDIFVADQRGIVFLHNNKKLIGVNLSGVESVKLGLLGKSGEMEGHGFDEFLSLQTYSPIQDTKWVIVNQQYNSIAFRDSSKLAFTIFLVTVTFGIGALLATIYLMKRRL